MLPGHDGRSNVVYDEAGTVYCYDKASRKPVCRKMSYIGHEPSRGTLKYRCPARHEGFGCASEERCNAGKKYGMTVRVKEEWDLRRFPPIPRATLLAGAPRVKPGTLGRMRLGPVQQALRKNPKPA